MLITDKLLLILHAFKISHKEFCQAYSKVANLGEKQSRNNLGNWLKHKNVADKSSKQISQALEVIATSKSNEKIIQLFKTDKLTPFEFLEKCEIEYNDIREKLSEKFHKSFDDNHVHLEMVEQIKIYNQLKNKRSNDVFRFLKGRWSLYRKHSSRIGLVRETVIINDYDLYSGTGIYYQLDDDPLKKENYRPIRFSAFFCGDCISTWGAYSYDEDQKIDPVVTTISLKSFKLDGSDHFPGLILALADGTANPSCVRIIIRKDSDDSTLLDEGEIQGAINIVKNKKELSIYSDATENFLDKNDRALNHSKEILAGNLTKAWSNINKET